MTAPPSIGAGESEWWTGTAARVFISCGQRDDDERRLAQDIREAVGRLGFCPYVAFEVHSSKSLTEGIYAHLRSAEYFLFVDYAREKLESTESRRGSLFSNQELAIASYLGLDSLYLVEAGVKRRDGIIGVIQGNPIEFVDRRALVAMVEHEIRAANWQSNQRRELRIERDPVEATGSLIAGQLPARYYHLLARNLNDRVTATECRVQVLGIRQAGRDVQFITDVVEMKWQHITWPVVNIPPKSTRSFDGMLVYESSPRNATLGILNIPYVDSSQVIQQHVLHGPGDFEADIVAFCREFSPSRATMQIHLETTIGGAKLTLKGPSKPIGDAVKSDA